MAVDHAQKFSGLWYDKGARVFNAQHRDFGATGDGSTNDTQAIKDAISAAASANGIVYLPHGTYRTDDWLDVDASDVAVLGAGRKETIIKPVDGADVGGFRVGNAAAVSRVTLGRIGFDGNDTTMTSTVKRLHAFIFDQATDCKLLDYFATRTHPYQEHNSGGSGVTLTENAARIQVAFGLIDDIGDRCIQMAGEGHLVLGNSLVNGYDRGVSFDYQDSAGTWHKSDRCRVLGNYFRDFSDGSCVAVSHAGASHHVVGFNTMRGQFRGAVQFDQASASDNLIVGNNVLHENTDNQQHGFILGPRTVMVANRARDIAPAGQEWSLSIVEIHGADCVVMGNYLEAGQGTTCILAQNGSDYFVLGNHLDPQGFLGINLESGDRLIAMNNRIVDFGSGGSRAGVLVKAGSGHVVRNNVGRTANSPRAFVASDTGSTIEDAGDNVLLSAVTKYDFVGAVTLLEGIGEEAANAETPTAANWEIGNIVDFTDTGDGSGNGVYMLMRDGSTWVQIG